jgi:aspartate/methionine/tyrosine aminotransferase
MKITPFAIERHFAQHEFTARHLLSCSDCEPLALSEVLALADEEVRDRWDTLRLAYTESQGLPLLRREIAGLYQGVDPGEVIEVIPEEGILLTMQTLLEPGDHVVATFPGYQSLYQIARDMGCEVTPWQPLEVHGWRFELAGLQAALRPATRLVVINFPHNPTGAMLAREELGRVVELVEASGAMLLSDEMYRWLEREPAGTLPSAVELSGRAISLGGLSKSLSAPGLRVGWLVTHNSAMRERLAVAKDYTTICASAPAEILAVAIVRARQEILARNRALIAANARLFEDFACRHRGFLSWTPPAGGPVAFARLGEATGAAKLCQRLTDEAGVMLLPSTVFEHGDRHVRIGLGRASFKSGLNAVDEWLEHP